MLYLSSYYIQSVAEKTSPHKNGYFFSLFKKSMLHRMLISQVLFYKTSNCTYTTPTIIVKHSLNSSRHGVNQSPK